VCDDHFPVAGSTAVYFAYDDDDYDPPWGEVAAYLPTSLAANVEVSAEAISGAHLSMAPSSLDFGVVAVGTTSAYRTVDVTNLAALPSRYRRARRRVTSRRLHCPLSLASGGTLRN
jgi:hypothetical protein